MRQITDGVDDPKVVLDRMVANGEIAEHQRGDVLFIPSGTRSRTAAVVGRRNVHTGEVEKVEVFDQELRTPSRCFAEANRLKSTTLDERKGSGHRA